MNFPSEKVHCALGTTPFDISTVGNEKLITPFLTKK